MIIVSDSGPLAYLVQIGVADHLPTLYGEVYVPPAVVGELRHDRSPVADWAKELPPWLTMAAPQASPLDLPLDFAEREAITLALELNADFLLIDERKGRLAAKSTGLKVAGTLAVLIDGASRGLFDGLEALERLRQTNFYASAELMEAVRIKLANARS